MDVWDRSYRYFLRRLRCVRLQLNTTWLDSIRQRSSVWRQRYWNDLRLGSIHRVAPLKWGRFEVTLDGELLYSKLETGRHMQQGEIVDLLAPIIDVWDGSPCFGICMLPQTPSE